MAVFVFILTLQTNSRFAILWIVFRQITPYGMVQSLVMFVPTKHREVSTNIYELNCFELSTLKFGGRKPVRTFKARRITTVRCVRFRLCSCKLLFNDNIRLSTWYIWKSWIHWINRFRPYTVPTPIRAVTGKLNAANAVLPYLANRWGYVPEKHRSWPLSGNSGLGKRWPLLTLISAKLRCLFLHTTTDTQ
jgi:hypothetical protein